MARGVWLPRGLVLAPHSTLGIKAPPGLHGARRRWLPWESSISAQHCPQHQSPARTSRRLSRPSIPHRRWPSRHVWGYRARNQVETRYTYDAHRDRWQIKVLLKDLPPLPRCGHHRLHIRGGRGGGFRPVSAVPQVPSLGSLGAPRGSGKGIGFNW